MSQEHILLILNDKFVTLSDAESIVRVKKQELSNRHPNAKVDQFLVSNIVLEKVELAKDFYNFIYFIDESGEFNPTIPNHPSIKSSLKLNQAITLNKKTNSKVGSKLSNLKKFKKLNKSEDADSISSVQIPLSPSPSPSLPELTLKRQLDIDTESKLKYFSESFSNSSDDEDIDELIDENELINTPLNTSSIICLREPNIPGVKRRKACKDCTCGLAEREAFGLEQEGKAVETVKRIQFSAKDLTEVDFTVEGKTGGCGSCSLGDAFRCSGCPFLGLPAFKPGQAINLDSIADDL